MSEDIKGFEKINNNDSADSDLMKVTGNLITNVNYKVALFLLLIGMIIFSDLFISNVLNGIPDLVVDGVPTSKGTMLQLIFMIFSYLIFDLLVQYKFI